MTSTGGGRGQTGSGRKRRKRLRDQTRDQEKGGQTTEPKASAQRQRLLHPEPDRADWAFQKRPPAEAGPQRFALRSWFCPRLPVGGGARGVGKNEGREVQEALRRQGGTAHSRRRLGLGKPRGDVLGSRGWTQAGWGPTGDLGRAGAGGAGGGQVGARSPCPPPRRPRSRAGALGAGVSRLTLPYLSDPCAELLLRERKRLNSRAGAFPRLEVSCSSRADAGWRSRLAAPKEARKAMEGGEPGGRAGQEGRRARRRACRWKGSHGPGEARLWGGAAGGWPGARRWTGSGTVWVGAGGRGEREDGAGQGH